MSNFSFREYKNKIVDFNDLNFASVLSDWAEYIIQEDKKGKIPLIIVGAGISACDVKIPVKEDSLQFNWSVQGLPCLQQMMMKLKELVDNAEGSSNNKELQKLKTEFSNMTEDMRNINREWLGRVFAIFEKSSDEKVKSIWKNFYNWFFFSCIEFKGKLHGAFDTKTSKAAEEIVKMYDSVNAICLSANFDNFVNYALTKTEGNQKGVPIFEKNQAERYLKRNRRGKERFENKPYNRCVLHANGDVFWLYCSGEKGEGYCPNTNVQRPAFDNKTIETKDDLYCDFCGSPLVATMTMPGTYEKDYNTRTIIECIWKYLSAKISSVITVGISCNWDDILLKFILQLIQEMNIPLLDINNGSDKVNEGSSQLVELVVKQSHLETCCYKASAYDGMTQINKLIEGKKSFQDRAAAQEEKKFKDNMRRELLKNNSVSWLKSVSQLGLKSYWMTTEEKNDRWAHSVEVADIATDMYSKLAKNSRKTELPFEKALLYAAGLLHDCGHLPFSHLLEDVFEELAWNMQGEMSTFTHAHYTKRIIKQLCSQKDNEFNNIIKQYGISPEEIIHLIEGRYGVAYMDALINSALDADKIAYIFTDAEKSKRNLALGKEEFLTKLLNNAYITQEGMIALEGESAWYAMRLLDERQRMYNELYYDTRIRCLEAMAKYIITTYFVQKYNNTVFLTDSPVEGNRTDSDLEDMGNRHILDAINDLHKMIDEGDSYARDDFSDSLGEKIKESIEQCMRYILAAKRSENPKDPDELSILQIMSYQLLGKEVTCDEAEDTSIYIPYRDQQLDELVEKLSYEELLAVRKKILLNYPGTVLIDVYKTTKYFSPSALRAAKRRPDGTKCEQVTILIPDEPKSEWQIRQSQAKISLSEYAERNGIDKERRVVFHLFKIGQDTAECDHAVNMLKKEMKRTRS